MQENKASENIGKERNNSDWLTCSDLKKIFFKKITFCCWTSLMVRQVLSGYLFSLSSVLPTGMIKQINSFISKTTSQIQSKDLSLPQFWGIKECVHNPKTSIEKTDGNSHRTLNYLINQIIHCMHFQIMAFQCS